MRIALVGELYGCNLGEPLLFDCSEYVIKEIDNNIQVCKVDIFGRSSKNISFSSNRGVPILYQSVRALRKFFSMINLSTRTLDEWKWKLGDDKKYIQNFYREKFCSIDAIIIMGAGTLKYDVRLNFAPYYQLIVQVAEELNIPVYVNCIGVESKYNVADKRCRMFEKSLSNDAVKIITTRDEIRELKKYVKNENTELAKIADVGTWAAETYKIEKKDTECIGLGVITPERFREFGRLEVYKKYEKFWLDLIEELDNKQIKWKIFNNGDVGDREFAEKLCALVGRSSKEYVLTPNNPKQLVEIVSGFQGIISSRLHSCIVAYSLKIPFVAISWNDKLQYFAREISVSERIVEEHELEVKTVWEKFEKAKEEGYDLEFHKVFRQSSKDYMYKYIQSMRNEEK